MDEPERRSADHDPLTLVVDLRHRAPDVAGRRQELLDPVELVDAFVREDALQCGFCTPGQIVSASALVEANPSPSREEIRHGMAGNLCRCGAYPRIEEAILTWRD